MFCPPMVAKKGISSWTNYIHTPVVFLNYFFRTNFYHEIVIQTVCMIISCLYQQALF